MSHSVHLSRYGVKRCACGCGGYTVVDRQRHTSLGTFESLWDSQRMAEAWNGHRHVPGGERLVCPDCTGLVAVIA